LIIQTIRQAPSGSGASEDAPNASGADPSEADQIDAQHQSCNPLVVRVGGPSGTMCEPPPSPSGAPESSGCVRSRPPSAHAGNTCRRLAERSVERSAEQRM
jgi:hypothetical protein